MNKLINYDELKTQFEKECYVIDLKKEYGDEYRGEAMYAISSSLSEHILTEKYHCLIEKEYMPFIYLTEKQGLVIKESKNNDSKYKMRNTRYEIPFSVSDRGFEEHHPEVAINEDMIDKLIYKRVKELLDNCLNQLSYRQKQRLITYFYDGKSCTEIAEIEGVSFQSVIESIENSLKRLFKLFQQIENSDYFDLDEYKNSKGLENKYEKYKRYYGKR